ncbi:hypothetical protein HBH98_243080 [Parastagonospora nodorum]|nr:hypothetical protein HBH53_247780 [Parastagonospora nodorum]KAH3956394.1 hypothetical protein HBH51_242650 [Parastagonospora nodorum]KAH4215563.1 hypothetical protein HBI06_246590 [Parastagonospora nodorum]KAH4223699.1 hypothetical protein HBI05_242500 [Parastagonospora nodorum]KAH4334331.1 hypothetical protein HBH98_243080 [Parastagonospora nodorum]
MIRNFASQIAQKEVGKGWVTRFLNRNNTNLISRWTNGMDSVRYDADSGAKYGLYFDLLHTKMEQYNVLPQNSYNMDEKGFMIGSIGRSKRVFSKATWEKKRVQATRQDGSREWNTILAYVGAGGDALPSGIIYEAKHGHIRASWVQEIEAGKHQVHVTSSPSGWTNNDIGLAWLEQVFDRYTKERARRAYRLLILDGHGSHMTMDFIEYCHQNRILLAILPPHSTHTLQPLDVVMFKPLSSAYSAQLRKFLHRSQGLLALQKGDFFPLFWTSWTSSSIRETILASFEATGIWPKDRDVILKRVKETTPDGDKDPSTFPTLNPTDWRQLRAFVMATMKEGMKKEGNALTQTLHHLQVENELLHVENKDLRSSLDTKKKRKGKHHVLSLQQRQEYHGGAILWSPRKAREARAREKVKEQDKIEEKLQKARKKESREAAKVQRQVELEERRAERERLKVVREKEKAKKQAERER